MIISNVSIILLQTISEQESTVNLPNRWVLQPQIQLWIENIKKKILESSQTQNFNFPFFGYT